MLCLPSLLLADEPDPHYWRLDQITAQFAIWEAAHPDIFHPLTLGRSGRRVPIPMAMISDTGPGDEGEPRIFQEAALHANEPNGTTAIMAGMAALLDGYGTDPAITARVDSLELYFVPILNVDGHNYVFSGALSPSVSRK